MVGSGTEPPLSHPLDGRDLGAAVLLADLASGQVVHANPLARALAPDQAPPVALATWGLGAHLSTPGTDGPAGPLAALTRAASGESLTGELVHRHAGQLEAWTLTALPFTGGEGPPGLRGTSMIVLVPTAPTDEATYRRAMLASDVSFTISDPTEEDNPLVWVNPAFTRTTGYPLEQVVGRNCRFLQGPDTDPQTVSRIRRALDQGRPVSETLLNYRADGSRFWNEVSISPVLDDAGRLVSFVGVQQDVTARVDAEATAARALEAERQARARLTLLADVAEALTELDTTLMLRRLARVLARDLLDWCAVLVHEDSRLVMVTGPEEPVSARPFLLPRGTQLAGDDDPIAAQLAGSSTAGVLLDSASPHPEGSVGGWVAETVCSSRPGACMSIPIPGRRGVLGLLVVPQPEGGRDPADEALLMETARRAGLSLENARLYTREHLVAETLQRSMLPEQAIVPGLDLWSYYAPNVDHAQVGGDWYDVLQPEGTVGIVIGDVVGHDIEAAAAMGQLRSVVRAYAFDNDEPGTVLMRVDQLVRGMRIARSASMVYARLEQDGDGAWEMAWCRAGHLPPILVSAGRATALMAGGGSLIGIGDRPRTTCSVSLQPGDVVVFYTDGLIERRSRRLKDGLARLVRVCAALVATDAAGIGEQLLASLGEAPDDDMAVVVLRVPSDEAGLAAEDGPRTRRWQLVGESTSIGRARRLTLQTCRLWGMDLAAEAELVVSELVANAVMHGWGRIGLRLAQADGGLLVEVEDENPHAPAPTLPGRGPGGYGLHVVERLAEWGWRPSGNGKTVWARVRGRTITG